MTDDEATLYATFTALRRTVIGGTMQPTPTPANAKALRGILAECGDLLSATVYVRWVYESQDRAAQRLLGRAPWPDGDLVERADLVSLARNIPPRLAEAQRWAGARAPAHGAPPSPDAERAADACLAVLADLRATVPDPRVQPPRHDRHPNPRAATRAVDLLRSCGDWELYVEAPDTFRSRLLRAVEARP